MMTDEKRIVKIDHATSIDITGRDQDGDYISVKFSGRTAQQILNYLKNGILDQASSKPLVLGG